MRLKPIYRFFKGDGQEPEDAVHPPPCIAGAAASLAAQAEANVEGVPLRDGHL